MSGDGRVKLKMPKSYVAIAGAPDRRFEITGGLQRGYASDHASDYAPIMYSLDDVLNGHHAWQNESGLILGIVITPATISYGWLGDGEVRCSAEPGFIVSGSINVLYHTDLSDQEAHMQVASLAAFLADWLEQTRIYYSFMGQSHILEEEAVSV